MAMTPDYQLPTNRLDGVILAVAHDFFKEITLDNLKAIMNNDPILINIRGIFDGKIYKEMERTSQAEAKPSKSISESKSESCPHPKTI